MLDQVSEVMEAAIIDEKIYTKHSKNDEATI